MTDETETTEDTPATSDIRSFTYIRAFPAHIAQSAPNQITGRLVPFGVVADVADPLPTGGYDLYKEGFREGAFAAQVDGASRKKGVLTKIGLIHRHDGGLGYLGPLIGLREQPDGLWGDIRILPSKVEDVSQLIRDGVEQLSIEFRLAHGNDHTATDDSGVRWRTRVHLDGVALEPRGAYGEEARVMAFREALEKEERLGEQARQAEEQAAAKAAAAAEAAALLQAEADANLERRRQWSEMCGRIDGDLARQRQYVEDFGLTRSGYGLSKVRR